MQLAQFDGKINPLRGDFPDLRKSLPLGSENMYSFALNINIGLIYQIYRNFLACFPPFLDAWGYTPWTGMPHFQRFAKWRAEGLPFLSIGARPDEGLLKALLVGVAMRNSAPERSSP